MSEVSNVLDLIKAGNKAQARQILIETLQVDRDNEQAWLYMAACAANKAEFEQSIQQVLRINPLNSQAINLAEANGIQLSPETRKAQKQQEKAKKKRQRSGGGGRRILRVLLLLILLVVVLGGAVFVFLGSGGDDGEADTEAITEEATETANDQSDDDESEVEEEATQDVTEEPTEAATATPTEIPPTATPTESPTPEAVDLTEIEEEDVALAESESESEFPIFEDPSDYLINTQIKSGRSDDPLMLDIKSSFLSDDDLNVVARFTDHGEDLEVEVSLQPQTGGSDLAVSEDVTLEIGEGQEIIIPVDPADDSWRADTWVVQVQVNGVRAQQFQFLIADAPPTPQPEGLADISEADVEEAEDIEPIATEEAEVAALDEEESETFEEVTLPEPTAESLPEDESISEDEETEEQIDDSAEESTDSDEDATLQLVFDEDSLFIINLTEEAQDISELRFVQQRDDGFEVEFTTDDWQVGTYRGPGSIYALQPQACFTTGNNAGAASATPEDCFTVHSWVVAGATDQFWIAREDKSDTFMVLRGDEEVTECEISDGSCAFTPPPLES